MRLVEITELINVTAQRIHIAKIYSIGPSVPKVDWDDSQINIECPGD